MKASNKSNFWLWLTLPLAVLLVIATIAGAFDPQTYTKDAEYFAVQGIAQDYITLFVTVPVMLVSFVLALRGSLRARLVWLGMLFYTLYSYVLYAFFVNFNSHFLVYSQALALSLYALIGTLVTTDHTAVMESALAARKNPRRFKRTIGIFLLVIAGLFYMLWLSEVIPALLAGITPQSILDNGLPTNPVHVLDLSVLLPGLIITAVLIFKEKPLGYVIAPMFFGYAAMLGLAIIAMVILMAQRGFPIVIPQVVIFALMTIVNTGFLVTYTKGMKEN